MAKQSTVTRRLPNTGEPWLFAGAGSMEIEECVYIPYAKWWNPKTWFKLGGTITYSLKYTPDPQEAGFVPSGKAWEILCRDMAEAKEKTRGLAEEFSRLRKQAPPLAAKRAWRIRLGFEVAGVIIAAIGAWWIYPPAALLLVGAWMLGDVLVMRRAKKARSV